MPLFLPSGANAFTDPGLRMSPGELVVLQAGGQPERASRRIARARSVSPTRAARRASCTVEHPAAHLLRAAPVVGASVEVRRSASAGAARPVSRVSRRRPFQGFKRVRVSHIVASWGRRSASSADLVDESPGGRRRGVDELAGQARGGASASGRSGAGCCTVPPAPGMSPIAISGSRSRVSGAATMRWRRQATRYPRDARAVQPHLDPIGHAVQRGCGPRARPDQVRGHRVGGGAELVEVPARAERRAGAVEHHAVNAPVPGRELQRRHQRVPQLPPVGVATLRPVEGDP